MPSQSNASSQNGAPGSVIVVSRTQPVNSTSRIADTNAGSVAAYVNVNTTPAPVAGGSAVSRPQSAASTSRNQFLNTRFVAAKTLKGGVADFEENPKN